MCLEVNWVSNCKSQWACQWHSKMDRDQQLNFTTSIKCTMDRFIGQFKFAGKTLRARNQNRESGRNQSFLFQEVQLIDMHSVPSQHLIYAYNVWKFVSHILWEWQLSEISCINNTTSISYIFCILGIFLFTLSTVQLQSCLSIHEVYHMKAESKLEPPL